MASRAEEPKKSTMELGGPDERIALADAELDKTVQWALWGRMNNGGQCCVASKRIIVVDEIADKFLERFQVALADLKAGDPFDKVGHRRCPRCRAQAAPGRPIERTDQGRDRGRRNGHPTR